MSQIGSAAQGPIEGAKDEAREAGDAASDVLRGGGVRGGEKSKDTGTKVNAGF